MNVIHINFSDKVGGAAIATWRLHQKLLEADIESHILAKLIKTQSLHSSSIPQEARVDRTIGRITQKIGFNDIHLVSSLKISQYDSFKKADIIHLHNLHHNYFNFLALPTLTQDKLAVITLHDMWPLTGHCGFSRDCDRWQTGCGNCPDLKTFPPVSRDTTRWTWKLKKWAYSNSNIAAVIATSRWSNQVLKKSLLTDKPVHYIPLGIDTTVFKPHSVNLCRSILELPKDKKIALVSAQNLSDPRKGFGLLAEALALLPTEVKENLTLIVMGGEGYTLAQSTDIHVVDFGFVSSDRFKALLYSSADFFICPSLQETFGLVSAEALACGTPVVAFAVGAIEDLVVTGVNGYIAPDREPRALTKGIEYLFALMPDQDLRKNCRKTIMEKASLEKQVKETIALYRSVLSKRS